MTKVRLQHYVPQFYLRNFALKKKKKYLINCFDKIAEKSFTSNVANIACESYFYDKGDFQPLEKELGTLETKSSKIIRKIVKSKDLNILNDSERKVLSEFIATQDIRTRESIKDLENSVKAELLKREVNISPEEAKKIIEESYDENLTKDVHRMMLSKESISQFVEPISKMIWILYLNQTEIPFWISDHPVNRYNHFDLSPYGNMGLLSPGINIYFPITPKISLFLADPKVFDKHLSDNTTDILSDVENIIFQNHLQAIHSYKHVLSNNEDFSLLKEMVKDNPQLIKHRKRVVMG